MDADHSGPFFRSLVDILQGFSRNLVDHSHCVEVTGYICVETDHWKKEKYVLNEVVRRNGSAHSKSHCFDVQMASRKVAECCHEPECTNGRFDALSMPEKKTGMSPNKQRGDSSDSLVTNLDPPAEPKCIEESRPHLRTLQAACPDRMSCDSVAVEKKHTQTKQVKQAIIPTSMLLSYVPSSQSRNSSHGSEFSWAISVARGKAHDESNSHVKVSEKPCSKRRRLQTKNTEDIEPASDASSPKCRRSEVNQSSANEIGKAELCRAGLHNDDKVIQSCSVLLETPLISSNASEEGSNISASPGFDGEEDGRSAYTSTLESTHAPTSVDVDLHVDDNICSGKSFENKKLSRSPECVSSSKLDCQAVAEPEEEQSTLPVHVKPGGQMTVISGKSRFGLENIDEKVPDSSSAESSVEACEAKAIGGSNIDVASLTKIESMVNAADSNTYTNGTSEKNVTHSDRYIRGKRTAARFQEFHLEKTGRDVDLLKTSPKELNMLLLEYLSEVKKLDGGELKPKTLRGMFERFAFYMKENGYPWSITTDQHFQTSKDYIKRKQQEGVVSESYVNSSVDVNDLEVLLQSKYFGPHGPASLTRSMWFMNSQFLGLTQTSQHAALRWGDVCLKTDEQKREYLERPVKGNTSNKLYAKPRNPNRCFVSFYKQFRDFRPAISLVDDAPFYLTYQGSRDRSGFLPEPLSSRTLGRLWSRLLLATGLPMNKKISNPWIEG